MAWPHPAVGLAKGTPKTLDKTQKATVKLHFIDLENMVMVLAVVLLHWQDMRVYLFIVGCNDN